MQREASASGADIKQLIAEDPIVGIKLENVTLRRQVRELQEELDAEKAKNQETPKTSKVA